MDHQSTPSSRASVSSASDKHPTASAQDDDGKEDPNGKRTGARKRTKTGCLTCRKRRIKCDEGRPTCNNCIKSKRQCEGYNQRVVFKNPMGALQGGPFGPTLYPPGSSHLVSQLQAKGSGQGPLPMIAPKPPSFNYHDHSNSHYGHYPPAQGSIPRPAYDHNFQPVPPPYAPLNNLVSPEPPAEVNKTHQDPHSHHFRPPPNDHAPEQRGNGSQSNGSEQRENSTDRARRLTSSVLEYDLPEDDTNMAESDDEEKQDPREILGPVVKQFSANWDMTGTRVRAFSTFAQCNVLSDYTAPAHISELKDPRMVAIFLHFVQVTGPSMSLYERHPFDHTGDKSFDPTLKGQNNLWSYTFPIISFHHPALLHAILAMAALQIAKLQKMPATAAMKHYHLAIRRIAKNVKTPLRRRQPPTLAATLLLAYFEVWSSEHTKWCNHLFGARILFREVPLREMSRQRLPVKRFRQAKKDAENQDQMNSFFPGFQVSSQSELLDLDYTFLNDLSGLGTIAEDYGLAGDQPTEPKDNSVTDRDIEQYENMRDLYWWYCKMDVYQSILGGTKLFMEYEHWSQCPPRAPMSKLEAIYGTYDHLMLLLGRLANFAATDVSRKRRVAKAKGPPSGPPGSSPPMFPGIMPTNGKFNVPMGFTPPKDASPQSDFNEDLDPDTSYQIALTEWESIKHGFEVFLERLGPEFQPLRPEYSDRRDSPFGMTQQYRTFSVAGVWMNYYMGMIHIHRTHPSMPPAAMQAAGMAAPQTGEYSNKLGRVVAGLSDDCSQMTEISTLVSAAFIESCFCLFVAAIDYRDDAQRHWVVRRLRDTTRLTGWQSADVIAGGCESAWLKAAQLGRGPPYTPPPETDAVPISVWHNPRRIDRKIQELGSNDEQRVVVAKSERAFFALGLLSVEQDLEVLDLKDDG